MNLELQGELGMLRQKNLSIDVRADATVRAIKQMLNRGGVTCSVEDLDIEGAASLIADLVDLKREKIQNMGTIKRIEKEIA